MTTTDDPGWVPGACTLPSVERPFRLAEFDELFATGLRGQQRLSASALRWELDPAVEATARELPGRVSGCCSFFVFTFRPGAGVSQVEIEVPPTGVRS